jgi:hypothetical protein
MPLFDDKPRRFAEAAVTKDTLLNALSAAVKEVRTACGRVIPLSIAAGNADRDDAMRRCSMRS